MLKLWISWKWTQEEPSEPDAKVTRSEAQHQLELSQYDLLNGVTYEWFAHEAELARYLRASRIGRTDQLWLVRLAMLASRVSHLRLLKARAAVSHSRIGDDYLAKRRLLVRPERRDIRAIMNWNEAKVMKAKQELSDGRNFLDVAERYNQTPEGGLRLGIPRAFGHGKKRFEKDYFSAPAHVMIGPLKEFLHYIFEVMKIAPGGLETLGEAEASIRLRLGAQDGAATQRVVEAQWRARTTCESGHVVAGCR